MEIRSADIVIDSGAGDEAASRHTVDLLRALRDLRDQGGEVRVVVHGPVADLPPDLQALTVSNPDQARPRLAAHADIALRGYTVRSGAPVVGRWIAAVRRALTWHVKEAYLDRIVERQVNYNQTLALEIERLQHEVRLLQTELEALHRNSSKDETP